MLGAADNPIQPDRQERTPVSGFGVRRGARFQVGSGLGSAQAAVLARLDFRVQLLEHCMGINGSMSTGTLQF